MQLAQQVGPLSSASRPRSRTGVRPRCRELLVRRLNGDVKVAGGRPRGVRRWPGQSVAACRAIARAARRCRRALHPTTVGAPTSRAASSSAMAVPLPLTVTTMPRASSCCVKLLSRPVRSSPLRPSSDCSTWPAPAIRSDNGVPFAAERVLQPLEALGLVAQARHHDRAHQARPSAAERPP